MAVSRGKVPLLSLQELTNSYFQAVSGLVDPNDVKHDRHSESDSMTNDDSSDNQIGAINSNSSLTSAHDTSSSLKTPVSKGLNSSKSTIEKSSSFLNRPVTPSKEANTSSVKESSTPSSTAKHKAANVGSVKKNSSNKKVRHR